MNSLPEELGEREAREREVELEPDEVERYPAKPGQRRSKLKRTPNLDVVRSWREEDA